MDLARQEYPSLLSSLEPEQAVDVLNNRVSLINKIHGDIADWLQERRRVEEQYAASLRKLSRRPQQDNAAALGVFQTPWQRIVASTENMAQSHETLAAKIQADVETPLRHYHSTNREIQSMGNVAGNLASIAKDLTSAQRKAQKLDTKGSNKAGDARSNVDNAHQQWESQAPFVFEQLQALDEARVNHLRDVLTQFQTHELDQVERARASAEFCLNALLTLETADEIKTFAARTRGQAVTGATRRDSVLAASRSAGANVPPTPPPPRNANLEPRNSSLASQDRLAPVPEPPKEKSKLGGLKRLGTVMGRRKSAIPPPLPSDKKKEKTRSFAPFRRQESSRSFQDLDTTGPDLTPAPSRDGRASSRHELGTPPATQESRVSAAPPAAPNGVATAQQSPPRDAGDVQTMPQIGSLQQPLVPESVQQPWQPQPPALSPQRDLRSDPFTAAYDTSASPAEESAKNFEIKDQPIPEDVNAAQVAMNNMANQLRLQAQSSGLNRVQGSVRGRRDVRNTMFIPNPNNTELPSPSATPSLGAPSTPGSAVTAPTAITNNTAATTAGDSSSGLVTPVKRSLGTGTIPEDYPIGSDTQSLRSSHGIATAPHHEEMHKPGLNASIVETVNTWFSDTGVTRSFVVGEIALAYNQPSTSSTAAPTNEVLRLQNFHQLEKCAQNPTFVTPSNRTEDHTQQPGTYSIGLSSISRPMPTIAFKYQLHLPETSPTLSTYSPLLITQAWQIIEGQASVICLYSLNPAFAPIANPGTSPPPPPTELTLKNVTVTVSLDTKPGTAAAGSDMAPSARAISTQMMPVQNAHFKKRSGAVIWRFAELTVKSTQERLLVRFMIENKGLAKRGGVDVKFEVPNMLGSALGVERLVTGSADAGMTEADPFADDDEAGAGARKSAEQSEGGQRWEDVQTRKVLVAGKYSAY